MNIKLKDVISTINAAPSGSFVGITDYVSEKGEVTSVTGHLGFSYAKSKEFAIEGIKTAIANHDFEPITVSGNCYHDGTEFNSRKRSAPIKPYVITYGIEECEAIAKEILDGWLNPKEKADNKVNLSEKENGLAYQTETGNFTFSLLVENVYYKEEKSKAAKEALGFCDKVEIKDPLTKVKAEIRERFEKKFRTFTLAAGKFATLSIGGTKFESQQLTL